MIIFLFLFKKQSLNKKKYKNEEEEFSSDEEFIKNINKEKKFSSNDSA